MELCTACLILTAIMGIMAIMTADSFDMVFGGHYMEVFTAGSQGFRGARRS